MITLRELSRSDRAIGAITADECRLMAAVLDVTARSRLVRFLLPKEHRAKALELRMLAAILGRSPSEREPSVQAQIKLAMERDRG
jgi:DNA-binding TFAR19-related protein (PDSD5 family)